MGKRVIDRCNLVVLFEKGQDDLAEFLSSNGVDIVASLPCYTEDNTDKQRGRDVFRDRCVSLPVPLLSSKLTGSILSISALQLLNGKGYGDSGTNLRLELVYNPVGPSLPGQQAVLEAEYRMQLQENYGISFSSLFVLTNMPIKRFADSLVGSGHYVPYMKLLASSFNTATVKGLMCRDTINVAWDGKIFDCDFNAAMEMGMFACDNDASMDAKTELSIWNLGMSSH
jgi:hypothetical protein